MDIKLKRDQYQELIDEAEEEALVDHSRWAVAYQWVVPHNGKHYRTECVRIAATESQETEWPDEMTLEEVELKEVVTKQWVPVQS